MTFDQIAQFLGPGIDVIDGTAGAQALHSAPPFGHPWGATGGGDRHCGRCGDGDGDVPADAADRSLAVCFIGL
jgi:hypothetical protein